MVVSSTTLPTPNQLRQESRLDTLVNGSDSTHFWYLRACRFRIIYDRFLSPEENARKILEILEARGFILPDGSNNSVDDQNEEQEPEVAEPIEA